MKTQVCAIFDDCFPGRRSTNGVGPHNRGVNIMGNELDGRHRDADGRISKSTEIPQSQPSDKPTATISFRNGVAMLT